MFKVEKLSNLYSSFSCCNKYTRGNKGLLKGRAALISTRPTCHDDLVLIIDVVNAGLSCCPKVWLSYEAVMVRQLLTNLMFSDVKQFTMLLLANKINVFTEIAI